MIIQRDDPPPVFGIVLVEKLEHRHPMLTRLHLDLLLGCLREEHGREQGSFIILKGLFDGDCFAGLVGGCDPAFNLVASDHSAHSVADVGSVKPILHALAEFVHPLHRIHGSIRAVLPLEFHVLRIDAKGPDPMFVEVPFDRGDGLAVVGWKFNRGDVLGGSLRVCLRGLFNLAHGRLGPFTLA